MLHQAIDGREKATEYAVWSWDDGDERPQLEAMSVALSVARDGLKMARGADPPFDHVLLTKRTVTRTAWVAAPENDLHAEEDQ